MLARQSKTHTGFCGRRNIPGHAARSGGESWISEVTRELRNCCYWSANDKQYCDLPASKIYFFWY